jgi:hypothetical protein
MISTVLVWIGGFAVRRGVNYLVSEARGYK